MDNFLHNRIFVTYLVLEMLFKNSPNKKYIGGFYEEDDYGMTTKC